MGTSPPARPAPATLRRISSPPGNGEYTTRDERDSRMESPMQPLAIFALASGIVMVIGVSATLVTRRDIKPLPGGINRWHRHGSIPLAAAGLALGAISRGGGQSPATHNAIFATAGALLLSALLCAVTGAVTGTRHQRASR